MTPRSLGQLKFAEAVGIEPSQFEYFTTQKGKYGPGSIPNWQLLFVVGIIFGAFISSKLSGEFKIQTVPDMWRERFGSGPIKRGIVASMGGAIGVAAIRQVQAFPLVRERKGKEATPSGWRPGKATLRPGPDLVGKVWKEWKTEMAFDQRCNLNTLGMPNFPNN